MEISLICCIGNYALTTLRLVANIEFTMCVCTMLFAKILQLDNTVPLNIVLLYRIKCGGSLSYFEALRLLSVL